MSLQSQFVINTLRRLTIDQAATMFLNQHEPKVHELVSELINDPEHDFTPILRRWAGRFPDYGEAVEWILTTLDVPAVVEALRRQVQLRGRP